MTNLIIKGALGVTLITAGTILTNNALTEAGKKVLAL